MTTETVAQSASMFRPDLFDSSALLLSGSVCPRCGVRAYPKRDFCWACRTAMSPLQTTASGVVRARSRVRVSPRGFPDDYGVAVVDTDDGFVVLGRLGSTELPAIGQRVRLTAGEIRRDGATSVVGPIFIPDDTPSRADGHAVINAAGPVPGSALVAATTSRRLRTGSESRPAPAYIAGIGMTAFGRHEAGAAQLGAKAVLTAIKDSGIAPDRISALIVGSAFGASAVGQQMLSRLPLSGVAVVNVENACASGTTALLEAVLRIRAGAADAVVAVGVDTPLANGGGLIQLAADDPVAGLGITLPALYALVGDDYLAHSGAHLDALAEVVVRSREAAAGNPLAARRDALTRDQVLESRPIADPLTLFQCAGNADGAAAVVVTATPSDSGRQPAVEIAALELSAGLTKDRFTAPSAAERVSALAYAAAGLGPDDVDVVECHDAFSPAALTALESLGLTPKHSAAQRLLGGDFRGGTSGPALNPSGGLLSRGHPPGATGLAQVYELTCQLRGTAGARQVLGARVGLLHSQGGTVLDLETNACMVGLLTRC